MPAQITGNLLDALGFDLTVGDAVFYPGATTDQDVRVEPDGDVRLGWWSLAIADLPSPYQVPAGPMRIVLTPRGTKALGGTGMEPIFHVRTITHQFGEGESISWGQLLAGAVSAPLTPSQYDELVAMIEAGSGSYDDTALTGRVKALEDEPDPTWDSLAGKPAVIGAGTSATAARDAIGAGTSSLQLGVGSTTAKRGDWTPARADLDTSTRDTLAKADAAVPSSRRVAGKALSADVTIGAADLSATGTKDGTTVLYGDNTWKTPPAADVRDKFLAADQSSTSATAWTQIPDLLITDAAGGQRWRARAILYYYQAAASGIQIRLRTGNPGPTTADTRIIGRWGPALTTSATGQANYQQSEIIRWGDASRGTGYTTDASFVAGPNAGPNTSAVELEADVIFDAGAGTGRQIAFDFMQRVADAANPTILLAESAVTFERIA